MTDKIDSNNTLNKSAVDSKQYRILIVDDEEINLKILRIYLEDKGYEVVSSFNGEEAIDILREEEVTACICDIRMPKISGIDVLNYVQQHKPIVPVIMLTGFIDINTAVSVMRQGASNYLTKPIDAGELIISVEKAIEHRKLVEEKINLEKQNLEYQEQLEQKVEIKTNDLQRSMLDMVVSLSNVVEERDSHLIGHAKRVAQYANMLARNLKLSKGMLTNLHYAAILHDIGKIGTPDSILKKTEPLTEEEAKAMQTHPVRGANILSPIVFLQEVSTTIKHHHENWDGTGYPDSLKGEEIPLLARTISLADYFDTLTTARPGKEKLSIENAISVIMEQSGKMFDPELVTHFVEIAKRMRPKNNQSEISNNNSVK